MRTRDSVGAFVRNKEGMYILLKTKAKVGGKIEIYWDIPKGGVEKNENKKEALVRELKEELGTDKFGNIKDLKMNFSFDFPDKVRKRINFDSQKVSLFSIDFYGTDEDIKVDKTEITDFVFVNNEGFLKKVSFDSTRNAFIKMTNSEK